MKMIQSQVKEVSLSTKRVFLLDIMSMIMIMIIFAFFINSVVNTEWLSENHFVK